MAEDFRVRIIEFGEDTMAVSYVREPRVTQAGSPVLKTETIVVNRNDPATAPVVDDFEVNARTLLGDLFDVTSDDKTMSLDEYEMAEDGEDELFEDLGMGDSPDA